MTNWRAQGVAGLSLSKASNKYFINCLVLVQPDYEINEVLNSIIIVRVKWGGWGGVGEGFAIEWGCLVILGSH